ncbi:MAG: response regulator [Parafilimonas sp.]|nr:response regulator [Parafilimonas sp.]
MKNTLLIVDDDEVMVLLLKKLFEKKYIVFTASDGVEAMCYLNRGITPDLIISDLLMENITGYEFIKHLLTSAVYKRIPVIVVSSSPANEFSKEFPAVDIINKPFDPLELKSLVDATIKHMATQLTCNN